MGPATCTLTSPYHVDPSCSVSRTSILSDPPSSHQQVPYANVRGTRSLYRRSLKLALDWAVHRHLWRGQALYIRSLFEANRNVTNPRQQRVG